MRKRYSFSMLNKIRIFSIWSLCFLTLININSGFHSFERLKIYTSDQVETFDSITWNRVCGHFSTSMHAEKYCSSLLSLSLMAGVAVLAPTPMIVPAALFAAGGYTTENDIHGYYTHLSEKFKPVDINCSLFKCNLESAADVKLYAEKPQLYLFYNQNREYPVDDHPYPQSHVWWYWTSATCLLASAHSRPLGSRNPFRKSF